MSAEAHVEFEDVLEGRQFSGGVGQVVQVAIRVGGGEVHGAGGDAVAQCLDADHGLEATGRAEEIRLVAQATAEGLRSIAAAISETAGGRDAMNLRLAEQYITEFGKLAKENNTMILPADLGNIASVVKTAAAAFDSRKA